MAKIPSLITVGQTQVKIKTNTNAIANMIKKQVQRNFLNPWLNGIKIATEAASVRFVKMLEKSNVIKALSNDFRGDKGGKDLPAEFGLNRGKSENSIVPKILEVAQKSFGVETEGGDDSRARTIFGTVNIGLKGDYARRLIGDVPHAEYESEGGDIPWMRWLLAGVAENDEYGIAYFSKNRDSRSKNALMSDRLNSSWFWDASVLGVYGNNFVEDVLRDPANMKQLNKAIVSGIKKGFMGSSTFSTAVKDAITIS